jgi:hypothetical protein
MSCEIVPGSFTTLPFKLECHADVEPLDIAKDVLAPIQRRLMVESDRNWVSDLTVEQMAKVAETADGRERLERAKTELVHDAQGERASMALQIAEMVRSPAFRDLGETSQTRVLDMLFGKTGFTPGPNPAVVRNVGALLRSPLLEGTSPEVRDAFVAAVARAPEDANLRQALEAFANTSAFDAVPETEKAHELTMFSKAFYHRTDLDESRQGDKFAHLPVDHPAVDQSRRR